MASDEERDNEGYLIVDGTPGKWHTDAVSVEGTVRWLVSENREPKCLCCDGGHHFGTRLELDSPVSMFEHLNSESSWIQHQLHRVPDGARVRISIEVL